jgi:pimeloyl-ACP methyl ester carboxylesterase
MMVLYRAQKGNKKMFIQKTNLGKVFSADGTPITFEQVGSGSPLLLVHGTGADRTRWAAVLPQLAQQFTVYSIDRRGHGSTGDTDPYAVEREYEDIAAVAAEVGGPVDVVGHSFGAACVLGAAPLISNLCRLVLYEPPLLHEPQMSLRAELLHRMDQALADGNREAVVLILLTEMLKVPLPAVDRLRGMPAWAGSVAAAHTIPRELRNSSQYGDNPAAIRAISAPALFLLGSDSPESFHRTTETLHTWLPTSQIVLLPGQQHSAMLTAPDLFAREILRFLMV